MKRKLLIRLLSLVLVIFLGGLSPVYAQGPDQAGQAPIAITPSGQLNLTFEQLGYDTLSLNRDNTDYTYNLDLPGNFQFSPTDNYLDLNISHIPDIPEKPSVLQVYMNKQLLSTVPLTVENADSNTLRIELSQELLRSGRNSIEINLDTGATCEDLGAFLDVSVDKNSTLSFGYQQNPYPVDLGLYPYPFTERSLLNIPITIVLPDQPTSDDLTVAATLAAGLGQASRGQINLTTVLASELTPDIQNNNHLIVIGRPDANSLLNELTLPIPLDSATLKPGQGILQEIVSPWNEFRLILVISGLDGQGLLKAGAALNRQAHFLGMRGPVAVVLELGPLPASDNAPVPSFTLASLNYEDQVVYGTQPKNYDYDFNLPLGWQLAEAPYIVFKFAHADIISPESALDIKLNNVPIGSTLLDESNAREGELTLPLPPHLLKAGRNRLRVGIEMKLPNESDQCGGVGNERAWTVISSQSEIFLPYNAVNLPPDLALFPYPFSQVSGFAETAFLLPDQPSPQTFNQLIQLAVRLGSASRAPDISAWVGYASDMDQSIRQNHHLVLLGRPTENSLLAEINPNLPQPFADGSDTLKPLVIDNVAFLPDPTRDAGLLQIIESPWNKEYSILAVTGTTAQGVSLAVQSLLEQTGELKGNLAVIEPALNPFFAEPNKISSYSVDTRAVLPANQGSSNPKNSLSEQDRSALANRWWK